MTERECDFLHPVKVGQMMARYDYDATDDSPHELEGNWIEFSYWSRTHESVVDHTGTIVDVNGKYSGIRTITVDVGDTQLDIDDIGVVRAPKQSRAHRGPITALSMEGYDGSES